jgi:hypothetical protein
MASIYLDYGDKKTAYVPTDHYEKDSWWHRFLTCAGADSTLMAIFCSPRGWKKYRTAALGCFSRAGCASSTLGFQ